MADLTIEQQQAIALANARARANQNNSQNQAQTLYTEDTVYNPMTGVPLSSPAYGPEISGKAKVAKDVLTNVAALPVSTAMGVAKSTGATGIPQLLSKLVGSDVGDQGVNAMNQIQSGMEQQGNQYLQGGANIVGQVAPWVMGGMQGSPLATDITSKAIGAVEKIPALPSFARSTLGKNVIGTGSVGGLNALVTPEKTGLTGDEFAQEKLKNVGISTALSGGIPVAVEGTKQLGGLLRKGLGISTGAGEEAFKQAYQAGKTGNQAFLANMKGEVPIDDVLNQAKNSLSIMRENKNALYRSGMEDISKDKTILDFTKIDDRLKEVSNVGLYKGQTINENAVKTLQEIRDSVSKWKSLDPNEFHTPEGIDALKQKVGSLLEDIPYGTKARVVADDIYHSIKGTIAEQAPTYNKVMKEYSESADLIKEIEKSLSLGNKSSAATAINKLQSLMRNNVNTNYGYRQQMANELMNKGGGDLMPALAGQALNSWTPRGLVGQGLDAGALLTLLGGASQLPGTAATMATTSPRLMGNVVYGAGRVASKITPEQERLAKLLSIQGINAINKGVQ